MDKGALIDRGRTAEIYEWGERQVLKLYMDWCPVNWADYELKIARIVQAAGLPVPKVEDIVQLDGRRGIIYERVSGPSIMKLMRTQPWKIAAYGRLLAELHVSIHGLAVAELPQWRARMEQAIRGAGALTDLTKQAVLKALAQLPDENALCHGDFHPGNVIMTARGPVIIDWVTAAQGHPLADVARTLLLLRIGEIPPGTPGRRLINLGRHAFLSAYVHRYTRLRAMPREQIEAWLVPIAAARLQEGIPAEKARLLTMVEASLLHTM